jgi:hypothetical protein
MLEGNVTTKTKRVSFGGVLIRPRWIGKGKKWTRRQNELWRTYRWDGSRSCYVLRIKTVITTVILQQDILRIIVDYRLPNQPAFRPLHEEIARNHVGLSRDDCQEALDLARKYEWPLSSNAAAKTSTSLLITPTSGVQS